MASRRWARPLTAFLALALLYQASEGLQTVIAPGHWVGPALMLVAFIAAWPLGYWLGGRGYAAYGLYGLKRFVPVALALMTAAFIAKAASLWMTGGVGEFDLRLALPAIMLALVTTFVPSVTEDILTRGFLFRVFPVELGPALFILSSALLYTVNHLWRFDWGITEQVRLFCLGLAYAAACWRWQNLWAAVALHWGWNLAIVFYDQLFQLPDVGQDLSRLAAAGVHLLLFVLILLVPQRQPAEPWSLRPKSGAASS